jgi:hypothetical protein
MADVAHERSLVKKLEGKAFVLLGVNSDRDRDALQKVQAKQAITWRSWFDGGGTRGPIASRWNVQGWPTLYLLDAKGVIRYKGDYLRTQTARQDRTGRFVMVHLVDEAVEKLVKEAQVRGPRR